MQKNQHLDFLNYFHNQHELSKEIKTRAFGKKPVHEQLLSLLASPKEFLGACEKNTFQEEIMALEAKKIGGQIVKLENLKKQYEKLSK